jgi:WD40 repeat protein/tRNA A-37 threonylcarbamoyl transferase component Bud32
MSNSENFKSSPESQEEVLFTAARGRALSERAAFLDGACHGNAVLRERLEALLAANDATNALPEPAERGPVPTLKLDIAQSRDEFIGQKIGRYKMLERIGEGGCGVVYVAEQTEPVRRRVALKVIKPGMDTRQVVARFEAERQALAMMDHPNIAKVFDAGSTETGRPYFVMELVRGIRITEYCDQIKLPTKERLGLFIQVCHAIQHAHQKGIIHRDIKPSNILVTLHDGVPVPKVIDFGIAKATEGRLTDATVYTQLHQFIGTPAYMSPEQAEMSGLDIDTRSDIYSLGVLLYELLTGKTPFDARELMLQGLDVMRRTIREKEPVRPSTKLAALQENELTTTAKHRSIESSKLTKLVCGDLDWIVMKCLEKDRTRRYETSNGLAADLKRHLSNEPVVACPPSAAYRFQKSIRRNKLAFAAAGAVAAALLVGIGVSLWQAVRATQAEREEAKLRQRAEDAQATAKHHEELAVKSATEAHRQQSIAVAQEGLARRRFYAAQINLAKQAWDAEQPARTLDLLETLRPKPAEPDLRKFEWFHLWGLCNSRLRLSFRGNSGDINQVIFSPDMKMLAACGGDNAVRLWETASARELLRLNNDSGSGFSDIAIAPDGGTLVAGSWDHRVLIWNLPSGKLRRTLSPEIGFVSSVAISPDGKMLAAGGEFGKTKFFDLAIGTEQQTLVAGSNWVRDLIFSRDGSTLISASGTSGSGVKIWDIKTNPPTSKYELESPRAIALSYDDKTLATVGVRPQLWNTATGLLISVLSNNYVSRPVSSFALLRDGRMLAAGNDRVIQASQINPTPADINLSEVIGTHLDGVRCLAVSADESTLASGSLDGFVKVWSLSESKQVAEKRFATSFECGLQIRSVLPLPGNEKVLVSSLKGTEIRELASGRQLMTIPKAKGRLALSPDASLLASSSNDGMVRLWELSTGRLIASIKAHLASFQPPGLSFSPDGLTLATGTPGDPNGVKLWDLKEGLKFIKALIPCWRGISGVKFANGKKLAVAIRFSELAIVDTQTGELERRFPIGNGDIENLAIAYSPDGRFVATARQSGAVSLWNTADGRLHTAMKGHTDAVRALAFSPDGETLASGGEDRTVRLWDVASGQERVTFRQHHDRVFDLAFTPDGKTLVSADWGGTVWVLHAPRPLEKEETIITTARDEESSL